MTSPRCLLLLPLPQSACCAEVPRLGVEALRAQPRRPTQRLPPPPMPRLPLLPPPPRWSLGPCASALSAGCLLSHPTRGEGAARWRQRGRLTGSLLSPPPPGVAARRN
jgi:hypothetical protein